MTLPMEVKYVKVSILTLTEENLSYSVFHDLHYFKKP